MAKDRRQQPATFRVGDKVRVKSGIRDTDYPDVPLGGWAGTISEVHGKGMYTVRWSEETLAAIDPVFKKRCEKDGAVLEEYWLHEDDLVPDEGGPLQIEHPTVITSKPLSPRDQDDRIRMVLGLTSNDPLPDVDEDTLQTYYDHLTKHLSCPFPAEFDPQEFLGPSFPVEVISLDAFDDVTEGIMCRARHHEEMLLLPLSEIEAKQGKANRQLVDDYAYWFHNWG